MALTPNGLVTISGSPANGEQPTQNAGATMVDGVIVPAAGFIGIGSGAAQVDAEVFGVAGSARVSNVLAVDGSPLGAEKLYVNGDTYINGWYRSANTKGVLVVNTSAAAKIGIQLNGSDVWQIGETHAIDFQGGSVSINTFGDLIQNPSASVTPSNNGEFMVEATNNTTLTFKLKGTDGTVRSGTIALS